MHIFGVSHKPEYFEVQTTKIEDIFSVDGKVMMLELAPNYEENIQKGLLHPNFFVSLAKRYRPRCTQVICGDQELTMPEKPDWILSCFFWRKLFLSKQPA